LNNDKISPSKQIVLSLPAYKEVMKIVLGAEGARQISQVPTLADIVGHRVSDISCDNEVIGRG
jgi:hypothetical protein